jgi:hypothetical protein
MWKVLGFDQETKKDPPPDIPLGMVAGGLDGMDACQTMRHQFMGQPIVHI